MSAAERVGALERGALRNALAALTGAIADIEKREGCGRGPVGIAMRLWAEGSGAIIVELFDGNGNDPDLFVFHSLDELVPWVLASPSERAAIESAERAARDEREAHDFEKLDALMRTVMERRA